MNEQSENKNNPEHDKVYTLIVNGREKTWNEKEISFEQVVILAFGSISPKPNMIYTITYKRGHGNNPEGLMEKDDILKVKDGMIFNVTATDKS
ncbi:MAG: multiubiquitin domain-containing protein [Candidatus Delongbacteria bacterium]|nr:multiubiquitin domain-containing protein [Candidatus Delongbacteria bacterium]